MIHLLTGPGDYVFPGAPIAVVKPPVDGGERAVESATVLGSKRVSTQDLEEVALRALSPGINDPHTAMSVLVRFGTVLCGLAGRHLEGGVVFRDERPVMIRPSVTCDGLTDAMFHMIRQNAAGSTAVICTGLDVMIAAASVDGDAKRLAILQRDADLWIVDARRDIANRSDLADAEQRHDAFALMRTEGPLPREWRDVEKNPNSAAPKRPLIDQCSPQRSGSFLPSSVTAKTWGPQMLVCRRGSLAPIGNPSDFQNVSAPLALLPTALYV